MLPPSAQISQERDTFAHQKQIKTPLYLVYNTDLSRWPTWFEVTPVGADDEVDDSKEEPAEQETGKKCLETKTLRSILNRSGQQRSPTTSSSFIFSLLPLETFSKNHCPQLFLFIPLTVLVQYTRPSQGLRALAEHALGYLKTHQSPCNCSYLPCPHYVYILPVLD